MKFKMLLIIGIILITYVFSFSQNPEWICYTSANSPLPSEWILGIKVEHFNNFWVGTQGSGIFHFNNGSWESYNSQNTGLLIDYIWPIEIDNANNKWFGTVIQGGGGDGLYRYDGTNWTSYNTSNSDIAGNTITYLKIDGNGLLWVGNDNGISIFDGQNWKSLYLDSEFKYITAIAFEDSQTYWFGTNFWNAEQNPVGGLYKYNSITKNYDKFSTNNSDLSHNFVYGIDLDTDGNKWIATSGGGAAKFDGSSTWNIFTKSNSEIPSNSVFDVLVDKDDNIWFATISDFSGEGGVAKYNGSIWTAYDTNNSELTSNMTFNIEIDEYGNKYFTCYNGLCIFNESGITNVQEKNTLRSTFKLSQNYPNPFNPITSINYSIPKLSRVELKIYNIVGQEVMTLVNKEMEAGNYMANWNGKNNLGKLMPSGLYFYRIISGNYIKTCKMSLLR